MLLYKRTLCLLVTGLLLFIAFQIPQTVSAAKGGPDEYGYVWIDNSAPNPVVKYDWIEINQIGTNSSIEGDDESGNVPIGFAFEFYGNRYSTCNVTTNGQILFSENSSYFTNDNITDTNNPNNYIAPFWDDLDVGDGSPGTIWYSTLGVSPKRQFVVEWDNVTRLSGAGPLKFEAILNETGEIWFQYKAIGTANSSSATIGIENEDGTDGLLYSYNTAGVGPGDAVMFEYDPPAYMMTVRALNDYNAVTALNASLFNVSVYNRGSSADTYDLEFSNNTWTTKIYDSAKTSQISSLAIPSMVTKYFLVEVSVPGSALPGTLDHLLVNVTSQGNTSLDRSLSLFTQVPYSLPFFDNFSRAQLAPNWTTDVVDGEAGISAQTFLSSNRSAFTSEGDVSITTVPLDTSGVPVLKLDIWVRKGSSVFSEMPDANEDLELQYRNASGVWKTLDTFYGGGTGGEIYNKTYYLNGSALHTGFMFRCHQTSGTGNNFDYWHIDDVRIGPPPDFQLEMSADQLLLIALNDTDADFNITIENIGLLNDTYNLTKSSVWPVVFRDQADAKDITNITVPAGQSRNFIARMSVPDGATAGQTDDFTITGMSQNDSEANATLGLSVLVPFSVPFFDDFGSGAGSWENNSYAAGTSWELGAPTTVGPSSAYSPSACWGTNIGANYATDALCELITPPIQLGTGNTTVLSFAHWYNIEAGLFIYDGAIVEIYTSSNDTWTRIVPKGGYPQTTGDLGIFGPPGYSGSKTQWDQAEFDITDFNGEQIRIRFRFSSDVTVNFDGWYIDDVYIGPPPPYRFNVEPPSPVEWGAPGVTVEHPLTIYNTGTENDTYDLTSNGPWTVTFRNAADTATISEIDVDSGSSGQFIAKVAVPVTAKNKHIDEINISSQGDGSIFRLVKLSSNVPFDIPWTDDFETGVLTDNWTVDATTGTAGVGDHTSLSGTFSMYTNGGLVNVTSPRFDTSGQSRIIVNYWVRAGGVFSETPDTGEDLKVYYLDSGDTWTLLDTISGGAVAGTITNRTWTITNPNALHGNFSLMFQQTSGTGPGMDWWHIDLVEVRPPPPGSLSAQGSSLAPALVSQEQTEAALQRLTLTANDNDVDVTSISYNLTGSVAAGGIDSVLLVQDMDMDNLLTPADTIVGVSTGLSGTFDGLWQLAMDDSLSFFVLINVSTSAGVGNTVGVKITSADITVAPPSTVQPFSDILSALSVISEKAGLVNVTHESLSTGYAEIGWKDIPMLKLVFSNDYDLAVLDTLALTVVGSCFDGDIDRLYLYEDDGDDVYNSSLDTLIDSDVSSFKSAAFTTDLDIQQGSPVTFWISVDINSTATVGNYFDIVVSNLGVSIAIPDMLEPFGAYRSGKLTINEDSTPKPHPRLVGVEFERAGPYRSDVSFDLIYDLPVDFSQIKVKWGAEAPYENYTATGSTVNQTVYRGILLISSTDVDGLFTMSIRGVLDTYARPVFDDWNTTFNADSISPEIEEAVLPSLPVGLGKLDMTITFTEYMDTDVPLSVILVKGVTNIPVPGNWTSSRVWKGSLDVTAELKTDRYFVDVRGGKDVVGNTMDPDSSNTVQLDSEAPEVENFNYEDASNVPVDAVFTITFSEKMETFSADNAIYVLRGETVLRTGLYTWTLDKKVSFSLDDLDNGTYTLVVETMAADLAGNTLANEYRGVFVVGVPTGDDDVVDDDIVPDDDVKPDDDVVDDDVKPDDDVVDDDIKPDDDDTTDNAGMGLAIVMIILAVILVIIVLAVIIFIVMRKKKEDEEEVLEPEKVEDFPKRSASGKAGEAESGESRSESPRNRGTGGSSIGVGGSRSPSGDGAKPTGDGAKPTGAGPAPGEQAPMGEPVEPGDLPEMVEPGQDYSALPPASIEDEMLAYEQEQELGEGDLDELDELDELDDIDGMLDGLEDEPKKDSVIQAWDIPEKDD